MRGGEKMHFYSILKKVWVAILLMLLVCFPGVSSVLYAEETPRVVRDMLYTITDPSKASSTEMLAFFEKEKKLGVGTQIAVNKKKLIAYSGNTMTILQNVGFPEASILKERERIADLTARTNPGLFQRYGLEQNTSQKIMYETILSKSGAIIGFSLYPSQLFRKNAHFPDWGEIHNPVKMWLEPKVLVIEYYENSPKVLFLDVNHPTVQSFLNTSDKTAFEKMKANMKKVEERFFHRFEKARKTLEFLQTADCSRDDAKGACLLSAAEAAIDLGIMRNLLSSDRNSLFGEMERFWSEPFFSDLLLMSAELAPKVRQICSQRNQNALSAAGESWEKALLYVLQPCWSEYWAILETPREIVEEWSETSKKLAEDYKEFHSLPKNDEDQNALLSRVKALEMIKDRFYHLQKIRLSVSNRVRYAVEEMQMLDAFNDEDEWRKLYKAVSDGLQKEISENEAKIKEIRNREEEARKEAIIDELKRNMHQHLADPLSYVKDGRIFFEGYYTKELPVVGEAFRDGGVSGDSSLTKVNWTIADEDTRYQYSVIGDLGIVYVHAFIEGNIVLPGIDGGESRMQKMKLHLVRPLALEEGKKLPGQPPAGLSEQEAFKYDLGNRVFFTGMELNRQPVPKEMLNKAIRNLMFEIYDK